MEIPFHKPYITDDEVEQVLDTVRSGWLTMGPKTFLFEREFSQYTGAPHSVAVSSGTAALHLALRAIGLKPGDEVIVPTMTFTATAEVVCYFDALPVLADIESDTGNIDASVIERAITPRTRAVIPVHYGGQPCDMGDILDIAGRKNIYVIEDAAHCPPASYKGKPVGTIGDMTCFSFYATKPPCAGGGMVTTKRGMGGKNQDAGLRHIEDAWKRYSTEAPVLRVWRPDIIQPDRYTGRPRHLATGRLGAMWEMRKRIAERYGSILERKRYAPRAAPRESSSITSTCSGLTRRRTASTGRGS
jgi:perosamine synthetase